MPERDTAAQTSPVDSRVGAQPGDRACERAGERAGTVHNLYTLLADAGVPPGQRVNDVTARIGMQAHNVRRDLALALAPEWLRQAYLKGRVAARTVVLMQGLPESLQRELFEKIRGVESQKAQEYFVLRALEHVPSTAKGWTEASEAFEKSLRDIERSLDELLDVPMGKFTETYRHAGGAVGRRSLAVLVDTIIAHATELKQALARSGEVTKKGAGDHG